MISIRKTDESDIENLLDIRFDATAEGRLLYETLGFSASSENMELILGE